MDTAPAF